jgi:DNA-binding MarR family transcriptional regulator
MSKTAKARSAQADEARHDFDFTEQVGHLMRRTYQRHVAIFQQNISDSQLTAAQFIVLCAVRDHGSCSLSEIVKATAVDQATVRGIIERLKHRKLILVSHDPDDRRKTLVTLTGTGQALLDKTVPFVEQISEQTYGNLNPAERVALTFLLKKMIELDDTTETDSEEEINPPD